MRYVFRPVFDTIKAALTYAGLEYVEGSPLLVLLVSVLCLENMGMFSNGPGGDTLLRLRPPVFHLQ